MDSHIKAHLSKCTLNIHSTSATQAYLKLLTAIGQMSCCINLLLMNRVQIVYKSPCMDTSAAKNGLELESEHFLDGCGHALT